MEAVTHAVTRPATTVEPLLRRLIGTVLRARREAEGSTLRQVAERARVSVAYLSEVERGRKEASSEVLVAVCGALGMRLVDLIAEAHDELARADRLARLRPVAVLDLATAAGSSDRASSDRASSSGTTALAPRRASEAVLLAA
jgi:transcriptional regulator with XRE-family HTH domain